MDCGATCLRMVAKYYGKTFSNQFLRERSFITREGVSMLGISDAAEYIGFRTQGAKISLAQLIEAPLPCILHWNQNHFVVLYKVKKKARHSERSEESRKGNRFLANARNDRLRFYISDPAGSKYTLTKEEFFNSFFRACLKFTEKLTYL